MKKITAAILLALSAASSSAAWTVVVPDDGDASISLELDQILVNQPKVRVWALYDLLHAPPAGVDRSMRKFLEVDCAAGTVLTLEQHWFAGPKATGKATPSPAGMARSEKPAFAPPGTIPGTILQQTCAAARTKS